MTAWRTLMAKVPSTRFASLGDADQSPEMQLTVFQTHCSDMPLYLLVSRAARRRRVVRYLAYLPVEWYWERQNRVARHTLSEQKCCLLVLSPFHGSCLLASAQLKVCDEVFGEWIVWGSRRTDRFPGGDPRAVQS